MELSQLELFAAMSMRDVEFIKDISHVREVGVGEILFFQGDEAQTLDIVLEGFVKIYKVVSGRDYFLEVRRDGQSVNFESAFFGVRHTYSAEVITREAVVASIDVKRLLARFGERKQFLKTCISELRANFVATDYSITSRLLSSAEARVAIFLMQNASLFNQISNKSVADILNMAPETLSRIISRFNKQGFIRLHKNRVIDYDTAGLSSVI